MRSFLAVLFLPLLLACAALPTSALLTQPDTLRADAEAIGAYIGGEVGSAQFYAREEFNDTALMDLQCAEFNLFVPGNALKWDSIHPRHTPGPVSDPRDYAFGFADQIVNKAISCRQRVLGHVLTWDYQLPSWLTDGAWTFTELKAILKDHITSVVHHFAGRVYSWDVISEPGNATNWWRQRMGDAYMGIALKAARAADPLAKLYYDEYGAEEINAKSDAVFAEVRGLLAQGLPLDGVGFEYHTGIPPNTSGTPIPPDPVSVTANLRRFAALGLETRISQMDVLLHRSTAAAELDQQASIYGDAIAACLAPGTGCRMVTIWGVADRYWWQNGPDGCCGLLFDEHLARKPAYDAVRAAVRVAA